MKVGIIAEDASDILAIKTLICRIIKKPSISSESHNGKGSGKFISKCKSWADDLKEKKCSVLILINDLDTNNINKLLKDLKIALTPCPIAKYLICVPIQEIEAWLLSDPDGIKKALKLKKLPVVKCNPEHIKSPKEFLWNAVSKASNKRKAYIDTAHNKIISEKICLDLIKSKCTSFVPFYDFVLANVK